jgi:hypothetical protein
MKRNAGWFLLLAGAGLLTGCVERRYVITSDPPGAIVYENGKPVGPTPADGSFVYHGNYRFTLVHDGFEPLQVDQPIPLPWYEYPPIDFVAENLIPWRIKNVHRFHYQLPPLQAVPSDQLTNRAQQLRDRAATIGAPPGSPPPSAVPPLPPGASPESAPLPQLGGPIQP